MLRTAGIIRFLALLILAIMVIAAPARSSEIDAAAFKELIEIVKANAYLNGDLVKRLAAQKKLEKLGKQDPQAVVPLIIRELSPPRSYGKIAGHQRLALITVLRDIGPAAEASVPVLMEVLRDADESYESVKTQAAAALGRIGTPQARAAAQAYYAGLQRGFAAKATNPEAARSVAQSGYLIRKELRSSQPSDAVINASVSSLAALGPGSAPAIPTLLRAYVDQRLGTALHDAIGNAIRVAGVRDVESAAAKAAAQSGVPDILAEVIAETRHRDPFVRSLAMIELSRLGASEAAITAMIEALREGRNPGDAARVLGGFGKSAARALPDIARYFDDPRAGANAIQAVGKIGVAHPAVVAVLRRVLASTSHRHRGQAANALGLLKAAEALPELQQALGDGGKYVRILAAKALGSLGPDAKPAVNSLARALDDPDLDLRRAAVEALGEIGEAAAPATAAISKQLRSGDGRLKDSARQALAKIGGPQADVALKQDAGRFANSDLAEIRRRAATDGTEGMWRYLFRLPERRADPLARRLLSERQAESAYVGALFLAHRGEIEPAIPILADNLARRPGTERMFIGLAYSMMHSGDRKQVQSLFQGLARFIEKNPQRYSAQERARLDALLKGHTGPRQ